MSRLEILAPMTGRVVAMEAVPDPVFAEKMLGDGLAIEPSDGLGLAPVAGTLVVFHSACHAYAITSPEGVDVLVHVGLDTVQLEGQGFERLAEVGDVVAAGQPIVRFDPQAIGAAGFRALSPVLLPQLDEAWRVEKTGEARVEAGRTVLLTLDRDA